MIQNSTGADGGERPSGDLAGVSPVGPVNESRIIRRMDSAISVRCSTPIAAGRPRSDSITRVSTELGHSTLTPIGSCGDGQLLAQRLGDRHHRHLGGGVGTDEATPLSSPAIDAVLTMWAGVPWLRMMGRKLCSPWTTPQRLTSKTQRQSSRVWSRSG